MCIKDTTNTSASEEYGQTQKSDHKRKDKEEEKLINDMDIKLNEIPRASQTQQSGHRRQTSERKEPKDMQISMKTS